MSFTSIQNSFVAGELSPSLFGRTDLAKYKLGCSTLRNFFVNYQGGASSRAGYQFVGMCKQGAPNSGGVGSIDIPPRDIRFQFSINQGFALEFGELYMRIKSNGAYIVESGKMITAATNANPLVITSSAHGFSNGDWVYISGVGGMTQLNGITWIVTNVTTNTFHLTDLFGAAVNSTAYGVFTSGGSAARIYTVVSPYAAVDLPYLKFTQSANTMSLCLVNQQTLTEYATYDLTRVSNTNWSFAAVTFAADIAAPSGVVATAHASTTLSTYYSYVVTAVNANGDESISSTSGDVQNNDISIFAGSNVITWSAVTGATSYNVYKAIPSYGAAVPAGVLYGFMQSTLGLSAVDTNITADFTVVPPIHYDPFARGTPNPNTGTYPGVPAYFQQRRGYGYTLNEPDTYFFSKPGLYLNMDSSTPVSDGDAIIGTPWAQQINGIQWMIPMPNGLIILTGNGGWLVNGFNGGALTPSSQQAIQQANVGCSALVPPILINSDILYVQSKNSVVRDLTYNFFTNIYVGEDKTILANHLFFNHSIIQWAYSEEPYKIIWAVRDDGILLSLTWLKEQDIWGWARHDTNGLFVSVCTVTEPPVDAIYVIVKRYVHGQWVYYAERQNNRLWQTVEDCFCVDAGLSYPMPTPNATLTPAAPNGTNNISATNIISGGSGYTSPTAQAVDSTGFGTGATFSITLSGGVITAVTPVAQGSLYTAGETTILITDSTGSGALVTPIITNNVIFTTSASVFSSGNVGDVIRVGGGIATITAYTSGTQVTANITQPITAVLQDNVNGTIVPIPAITGDWTMTTPVTIVSGLNHLNGQTVATLADGSVVANQIVTNNSITLPQAASAITIGLPYVCQLQTMYLDPMGQPMTTQSKRKLINSVAIRVQNTRGISVGSDQPDASTQPNESNQIWSNMVQVKEANALTNAGQALPLITGDYFVNIPGGWASQGQVAIQQTLPLPANLLACISYYNVGDN